MRKLDASIVVSRNRRWDKRKKRGKVFAYILLIDDSSPFNSLITFTAHVCLKRSFAREKPNESITVNLRATRKVVGNGGTTCCSLILRPIVASFFHQDFYLDNNTIRFSSEKNGLYEWTSCPVSMYVRSCASV